MSKLLDNNYVGVEIEFENRAALKNTDTMSKYWRFEEDGSLRNGGMEIVFREPFKGDTVKAALYNAEEATAECLFTYRCGLHVHIDCRDLTAAQLRSFVMLYILFEPILLPLCGEGREESNFAVPVGSNYALMAALGGRMSIERLAGIGRDDFGRYSALNLQAYASYGSLEFRSMQGTGDAKDILNWIEILLSIKDFARKRPKLVELLRGASDNAPHELLGQVFEGDLVELMFQACGAQFHQRLIQGARNLQYVLHSRKTASTNKLLAKLVPPTVADVAPEPKVAQIAADDLVENAHGRINGELLDEHLRRVREWQVRYAHEVPHLQQIRDTRPDNAPGDDDEFNMETF